MKAENSREGAGSLLAFGRVRGRWTVSILAATLGATLAAASTTALASRAGVSSAARHSSSTSTFCQEAVIFNKSSITNNLMTLPPATIKSDYTKFKAAWAPMLANAPSSIKDDMNKIFVFDNGIFKDLSKVGWSVAKLTEADLKYLEVNGPKLAPASDTFITYLDKTCGLKLPIP